MLPVDDIHRRVHAARRYYILYTETNVFPRGKPMNEQRPSTRLLLPTLGVCALVAGFSPVGPRSELDRPWPAPVAKEIPAPEMPLEAVEALKTLTMPPGYQVELVAAEPLVMDPILAEFDGDGRLWVLEMHSYAYNPDMTNSFGPINHLVVLDDTDGDGLFDKRTVFMDGLVMPRAFKVLDKRCALVGAPPNLFHACDKDGDFKADTRDVIDATFSNEGVVEHGANGLFWGMDNMLHVAEHEWNLKLKGDGFAIAPSLRRGQWGVTQDSAGRIYRNVNTDPLFVDYISPDYYARNPNLVRTTGLYQNLVRQEDSQIWPARPTPGLNRGYRVDILREDGSASYYGGVSSPMIYRGDRLPAELRDQAFVVDSPTNLVHLLRLQDDGTGQLSAGDFYEKGEFLASTDERFRPVALVPGWDGSFYVIDMYRGVSQDGPLQTDYLRTYINERKLWQHINLGRIYRVTHKGWKPDTRPSMSDDSTEELVAHLSHPNGWWRDTAQQLLVQRADPAAIPLLKVLLGESGNDQARLQALWTLGGFGQRGVEALDEATVAAALKDAHWAVRAAALRHAETWLRKGDARMRSAVLALMADPHWQVRRQLAASLGELPAADRLAPILDVLRRHGGDPITVDVALSGLAGMEGQVLEVWLKEPAPGADVAGMLAGAVAKVRKPEVTRQLLAYAANNSFDEDLRVALLEGARLGLDGADGSSSGGGVMGGRAGSRPPGMRPPRAPSVRIEMGSAPAALLAMAKGDGPLPKAAQDTLAVIAWPGKPRILARQRTAAEEILYRKGANVYGQVCAVCHGAEGKGVPRVGAALAGSAYVNGDGGVLARILLHGKEGSIGLMPPVGTMADEDLAGVMTYIRGSFGNAADPLNLIAVKEYRQAYSHRDRPWTEEELDRPAR